MLIEFHGGRLLVASKAQGPTGVPIRSHPPCPFEAVMAGESTVGAAVRWPPRRAEATTTFRGLTYNLHHHDYLRHLYSEEHHAHAPTGNGDRTTLWDHGECPCPDEGGQGPDHHR